MKRKAIVIFLALLAAAATWAQEKPQTTDAEAPALTIYNQNFAVVRQTVPMRLTAGVNSINFADTTSLLEPDSVVLRDPTGARKLIILEQNYRNDPISVGKLLQLYEGQTIDFDTGRYFDNKPEIVRGKIIRSGYNPPPPPQPPYYYQQAGGQMEPIIEVNGILQFGLPGKPLFPALTGDTILKPTLWWQIQSDKPGAVDAELSYVTSGLQWEADYNLVAPETGDLVDVVGWITMQNNTGKSFENANIKLMAGDVNKVQQAPEYAYKAARDQVVAVSGMAPVVVEKAFSEYHLYTLQRPATLHDRETKQVEFVTGIGVRAEKQYVYIGSQVQQIYYNAGYREDPGYGTQSNPKVYVYRSFKNSEANHLGVPLPKGRMRFYQRDSDGHLEFIGENVIDHTPKDEMVRAYLGNAFDIVGERKRTDFQVSHGGHYLDETFEIDVRNHKKEAVTVLVREPMYRWENWKIIAASTKYTKMDSDWVEFPVTIPADGEGKVTYTVHYWW